MFGVGPTELAFFLVIVLLAVGPEKLPTFMRTVGKGLRQVRNASREFKEAIGLDELMREAGFGDAEATLERIGTLRAPLVRELLRNLVTAQGTRAVRERDRPRGFRTGIEHVAADRQRLPEQPLLRVDGAHCLQHAVEGPRRRDRAWDCPPCWPR